jgi:hypothetical protein
MGIVTISMDDRKMVAFRKAAAASYGLEKGHLKAAIEDAISLWLKLKANSPEADGLKVLEEGIEIGYLPKKRSDHYHGRLDRY